MTKGVSGTSSRLEGGLMVGEDTGADESVRDEETRSSRWIPVEKKAREEEARCVGGRPGWQGNVGGAAWMLDAR